MMINYPFTRIFHNILLFRFLFVIKISRADMFRMTVNKIWMFLLSPGFSLSSPLFNESVFSYAVIPWPLAPQSYLSFTEFELTFWPSTPDGMLLYSDDAGSGDFLAINLVDRYVEFRFDCGSGGAVIRWWGSSILIVFVVSYISSYIHHSLHMMISAAGVRSRSVWTHGMSWRCPAQRRVASCRWTVKGQRRGLLRYLCMNAYYVKKIEFFMSEKIASTVLNNDVSTNSSIEAILVIFALPTNCH